MAQCCDVDPLRPVSKVELIPYSKGFLPDVVIETGGLRFSNSFLSVDEAVYFACSLLRHSRTLMENHDKKVLDVIAG